MTATQNITSTEYVDQILGPENLTRANATLHHIELLKSRRDRLTTVQAEAEAAWLHQIGVLIRGIESITDRARVASILYSHYRSITVGPGFSTRWAEATGMGPNKFQHYAHDRYTPNGNHGTWAGSWPVDPDEPRPMRGQCVVYVLLDEKYVPCYVGSTKWFMERMRKHVKNGKEFSHWTCHPCSDREEAYLLEERLLREHKPYLNRKVGR